MKRGFERLAGKSDDGAFYLTQAMGGGKTHSLIAFGLLAADSGSAARGSCLSWHRQRDSALRRSSSSTATRTRTRLLWGYIAEKLGRADVMAPFWRNGAKNARRR